MAKQDKDGVPVCEGFHREPRPPKLKAPPGACDCHAHIFGPASRYPYEPRRLFTPPDASLAAYRRMLKVLGIERAVLVTASVYGHHNERQLDALMQMKERWRGVAVVPTDVPEAELDQLHRAGFRGVRVNLFSQSGLGLEDLEAVARRIAGRGWHIELHIDGRDLTPLAARLRKLPVDVVFDHMGHVPAGAGVSHPGFQTLLGLMKEGKFWAKLSAPYRLSEETHPYRDVVPFARALIDAAPERLLWASDWPHPAVPGSMPARFVMPNDGDLLDVLGTWTPSPAIQQKILADNPRHLYGFD